MFEEGHRRADAGGDALGIESAIEALRESSEFQGVVEPIDDEEFEHDFCEHLALIYESDAERLSASVPFVRQGLERGERCLYVVDDSVRDDALDAIRETGVDVDSALDAGQLAFHTPREMYLRAGSFDPDEMVELYTEVIEETAEEFEGLRVTAGTEWLLEENVAVETILAYESQVNELFGGADAIALCQYDRRRFPADALCEIIRTHPHLIYKNTVCHNFYYVPPEEYHGPDHSEHEVDRMMKTLLDRTEARTELRETMAELEESNRRLKEFAHIASHDLQEPLRMVSSYLRLLEDRYADDLNEEAEEYIDFAVSGADRMREMIDDLLAYSRLENSDPSFEPVDCDAVLAQTETDLQRLIEENDADVVADSLPVVLGDRTQLEQLFSNLITNAIKYQDEDPPRIEIGATDRGDRWEIAVSDNGIGMDSENTEKIFEVFERLHSEGDFSGTGIGLALCRRIVRNHGGEIWVESEPAQGSTFYFSLPQRDDQ